MRVGLQDEYKWHDTRVLWPRRIGHTLAWLEVAERRKRYTGWAIDGCDNGRGYVWEYRFKEKV